MTTNYNQSSQQIIVDLINQTNGTSFTGQDLSFGDPEENSMPGRSHNTALVVTTPTGATTTVYYTRLDLNDILSGFDLSLPIDSGWNTHVDILEALNAITGFAMDGLDIEDSALTKGGEGDTVIQLTALPTSFAFLGSVEVTLTGEGGGGRGEITFESLFQTTDDFWFDFDEMSNMAQLSTGDTPVTAVGQPVGYVMDKSVNELHLIQPTATARSLLDIHSGKLILRPDYIDDEYINPSPGVTGTFWFAGPTGVQIYTLDTTTIFPSGQFFECGFFGRVLAGEERGILQAYAESRIPALWLYDRELISNNYSAYSYMPTGGQPDYEFSDESSLIHNAETNDIPEAGYNGIEGLAPHAGMNYNAVDYEDVTYITGGGAYNFWPDYSSTGKYLNDIIERFPNAEVYDEYDVIYGSLDSMASLNAPLLTAIYFEPQDQGAGKRYGPTGRSPDLTGPGLAGLYIFRMTYCAISGPLQAYSAPAALQGQTGNIMSYSVIGNQLSGNVPSLADLTCSGFTSMQFADNYFTGYDGGGISATITHMDSFSVDNCPLTEAAVDELLADWAGTIGTCVSGGRSIRITGIGPATPSATGLAHKADLLTAGFSVLTN